MTTEDRVPNHLVELEAVTKSYEIGESVVTALDSASLTIEDGEFVVILGPSGSGKTTLLNMIGALDTPTSGRITVAGREITGASKGALFEFRRHTVSFIFQTFNLFPGLSARENVEFAIDAAGKKDRGSAAKILNDVGLGERLDHFPHQLSGGEQQRVAIARALAAKNPVLLADEPTGRSSWSPITAKFPASRSASSNSAAAASSVMAYP